MKRIWMNMMRMSNMAMMRVERNGLGNRMGKGWKKSPRARETPGLRH